MPLVGAIMHSHARAGMHAWRQAPLLARQVEGAIEQALPALWVAGEISNFRRYDSGHCYFVLKDAQAQVRCVMFRHRASLLGWQPTDGSEVELRAVPSLYEARGDFQLNVETMRRAGLGALFAAFERLKAKLSALREADD